MLIPLKQKYLEASRGGRFKSKSSNSGKVKAGKQGTAHRRLAYGPWWWLVENSQTPISYGEKP